MAAAVKAVIVAGHTAGGQLVIKFITLRYMDLLVTGPMKDQKRDRVLAYMFDGAVPAHVFQLFTVRAVNLLHVGDIIAGVCLVNVEAVDHAGGTVKINGTVYFHGLV